MKSALVTLPFVCTREAAMRRSARARVPLLLALFMGQAAVAAAQGMLERTPNLSGDPVGLPGMAGFDALQRFFDAPGGGTDLVSQPTLSLTLGLPGRILVGARYAAASPVAPSQPDEVEAFGRLRALDQGGHAPLDLGAQLGFNTAARSLDGEISAARWLGPLRLLGAVRAFSDAYDTGAAEAALAGGAVWHPFPGKIPVALAADVATLLDRPEDVDVVWGAGLQVGLPFIPNTLSLQVTNAASGTLQGSSRGSDQLRFGFEFTVPLPAGAVAGYFTPREKALRAVATAPPGAVAAEVPISLYAFRPGQTVIRRGSTVRWVNRDRVVHTATADDASWNSGAIPPGASWQATFAAPGVYPYHCGPHPYMKGVVVVR